MTAPAPHALVLDFVLTVRHDGRGGVADDLADTAGLAVWIREHADVLGEGARRAPADERTLAAVRDLRAAVRSLFARAVLPGPPSRADEGRLPPAAVATARLNAAAAVVPVVPALHWPDDADPASELVPATRFVTVPSARAAATGPGLDGGPFPGAGSAAGAAPEAGGPGDGGASRSGSAPAGDGLPAAGAAREAGGPDGGPFPGLGPAAGAAREAVVPGAGGASRSGAALAGDGLPAAGAAGEAGGPGAGGAVPGPEGEPSAGGVLGAVLARAAIAFLAGPDRARLRACHAPRCVRYFLKDHPRQEWCKPACGNRARVARHHERRRADG